MRITASYKTMVMKAKFTAASCNYDGYACKDYYVIVSGFPHVQALYRKGSAV